MVNLAYRVKKVNEVLRVLLVPKALLESKENAVFKELWAHPVHQASLLNAVILDHLVPWVKLAVSGLRKVHQ